MVFSGRDSMTGAGGERELDMKKFLRIMEILCWVSGASLVVVYFGLRFDGEIERQQAIAEFKAAAVSVPQTRVSPVPAKHSNEPVPLTYAAPDKTDWSKSRIQRFHSANSDQTQKTGLPVAILEIPRIGLEVPVYTIPSERNLNRGAALVAGTAAPDTGGNTAIAAHRDGYFRALEHIALGDILTVRTLRKDRRYKVVWTRIVKPTDISVLRQVAVPSITLITCYPFYFVGNAPKRFIVRAVVVN